MYLLFKALRSSILFVCLSICSYRAHGFSGNQKTAARYLESFYLKFRAEHYREAKNNGHRFLKYSSGSLKKFNFIVKRGIKISERLSKKKNCFQLNNQQNSDYLVNKFLILYWDKCTDIEIENIARSKKPSLSRGEKEFIKSNRNLFFKKFSKVHFSKRYNKFNDRDKEFLSNQIERYIVKNQTVSPHKVLKYLIPSQEVTAFIQNNKLFEKNEYNHFTQTLNQMINEFEYSFLNDEEKAINQKMDEIISFYESNKSYLTNSKIWKKFINNGKKLLKNEDYGFALNFFETAKNYAKEEDLSESIFHIIFTKYLKNDMYEARKLIKKQKLVENHKDFDSRLMYWIAYIVDINKELKLAKSLYAATIKEHPLSFYAILSLKRLQKIAPDIGSDLIIKPNNLNIKNAKISNLGKKNIKLLSLFKRANALLLLELQAINLRKMPQEKMFADKYNENIKAHHLIKLFSKKNMHLHSFKVAYSNLNNKTIALSNEIIKALFPLNFSGHVKSHNKGIDYRIVLSLIRQESGFNQRARSPAGARGLMQIMPRTGKYLRKKLKTRDLYNPKLNILLGSKYLKYLLKKFNGNLMLALAAYNAGEGNVGKWVKTIPFTKDVVADIEMIPFQETRKYVKLIYRNLFFYRYQDGNSEVLKESPQKTFHIKTSSL